MPSETPLTRAQRGFVAFTGVALIYTVAVAVFGAYVRASLSGDGCGAHWPLCNGAVVPVVESVKTAVELTHRVTSALCGFIAMAMVVWARRAYEPGHKARLGAWLTLLFVVTEGLVGGALVLLRYVAESQELARGYWMGAHLINTFVLLLVNGLTVLWAAGRGTSGLRPKYRGALLACFALMLVTGVTGAIAALGDTLFPVDSLAAGFAQDLSPTAHMFLRLRTLHPIFALGTACALIFLAGRTLSLDGRGHARVPAYALGALVFVQVAVGLLNLVLLAPVWIQMVHLTLAYSVWLTLVALWVALVDEAASSDLDRVKGEPALA